MQHIGIKMKNKVPKHIGIILDGNRRFSKRLMMKPWKGHEWGAEKVKQLFEWCHEYGVKELTLYCFSYENFDRPKEEFDFLMQLFAKSFDDMKTDERIEKYKMRINFIGRLDMFPLVVREKMYALMEQTKKNDQYIINFAMAYSGRLEVIDAAKKIAEAVQKGTLNIDDINDEVFKGNLYIADEPDMIIRTGGEKRISNFLNYQGAYAELFFVEKLWPEFEKEDFVACIKEYAQRDRRFGK